MPYRNNAKELEIGSQACLNGNLFQLKLERKKQKDKMEKFLKKLLDESIALKETLKRKRGDEYKAVMHLMHNGIKYKIAYIKVIDQFGPCRSGYGNFKIIYDDKIQKIPSILGADLVLKKLKYITVSEDISFYKSITNFLHSIFSAYEA